MPQDAWSQKDERMYEEIKKSQKEQGKSNGFLGTGVGGPRLLSGLFQLAVK